MLRRLRLLVYRGNRSSARAAAAASAASVPGLSHRDTRVCPRCGAQERHRALWLYMRERTDLFSRPQLSILHWAPEYALQRSLRSLPNAAYVSADIEGGEALQHMDMTDVPFKDGAFDLIVCVHVLEQWRTTAAMREMARVLKPGDALLSCRSCRAAAREDRAWRPGQRKEAYGRRPRRLTRRLPERLRRRAQRDGRRLVRTLDTATTSAGLFPLEDVYVATKAA